MYTTANGPLKRLGLLVFSCLAPAVLGSTGCSYFSNGVTPQRLEHGYTVILPGVEGLSIANSNLAQGLKNADYSGAIEIDNWTTGSFLLLPVHLWNLDRNRREAWRIAQKIVAYQDRYPGRPVHVIGHSGGGGVALWALEALPPGHTVTSAILLAPAVSPKYDLLEALDHTDAGIWNFYSPIDVFVLGAGTSLFGTIDGKSTPSAGAVGFRSPRQPSWLAPAHNWVYPQKLHQVPYNWKMIASGNLGGHLGPTWLTFSKNHLAPVLAESEQTRDPLRSWSATTRVSSPARGPASLAPSAPAPAFRSASSDSALRPNNLIPPAAAGAAFPQRSTFDESAAPCQRR